MKVHHSKILLNLIEKHSFSNMVEIGVGNGLTAKTILDGLVPSYPFVYYGIDPYKVYEGYDNDINGQLACIINNKNAAENNLKGFRKGRFIHFELSSSVAILKFTNKVIDLLFIDANHDYNYVKSDLEKYWSKISDKGIIAIHDYIFAGGSNFPGVKKAVDEFVKVHELVLYKDEGIVYFYKKGKIIKRNN